MKCKFSRDRIQLRIKRCHFEIHWPRIEYKSGIWGIRARTDIFFRNDGAPYMYLWAFVFMILGFGFGFGYMGPDALEL